MRPSICRTLTVNGLGYNLRQWGGADAPVLLLLHGSRDSSVTFQFLVDELRHDWSVLAPDWRGHGHSDHVRGGYWLHEFIADLDALLEQLPLTAPVPLVGHSLGGNIAGVYAGLRPERVSHLVSLDGFGLLVDPAAPDMRQVLVEYLDRLAGPRTHRRYEAPARMAERLRDWNPRLAAAQAVFLAEHLSRPNDDGTFSWQYDPGHWHSLPSLQADEAWGAIWSRIRAPALWIASDDQREVAPANHPEVMSARAGYIPHLERRRLPGTGHNLHHDRPAEVARLVEDFIMHGEGPEAG